MKESGVDPSLERLSNRPPESWRHPLDRDADTILYSSAWRRLRGITQVMPVTGVINGTHDRQIHSMKVAQVGMRAVERLRSSCNNGEADCLEAKAVYLAGLTHDLGHPPFGHIGEKELQARLTDPDYPWALSDSFEGNAQTFRLIIRNSRRKRRLGMDLTLVSIAAGMKYPWGYSDVAEVMPEQKKLRYLGDSGPTKWGYYDDDQFAWEIVRERLGIQPGRVTANAALMDIADDITYAVHDIHDYFRSGAVPLHIVGAGLKPKPEYAGEFFENAGEFKEFDTYAINALTLEHDSTPDELRDMKAWLSDLYYPPTPYEDSSKDRLALHEFESTAVEHASKSIFIEDGIPQLPTQVTLALEYLKELTWFYVINHPALSASQQGQRKIISSLHLWLCEWAEGCLRGKTKAKTARNQRRLPKRFIDLIKYQRRQPKDNGSGGWEYNQKTVDRLESEEDKKVISRAAVDYISELTDAEAASLFHHLGGTQPQLGSATWLH